MGRREDLQNEMLELRVEERELDERATEIAAKLKENRDRQQHVKALLLHVSKTNMRLQSVTSDQAALAAFQRMEAFTKSEAAAELGWDPRKTAAFLKRMVSGKVLEPAGKIGGEPRYRYVGPIVEEPDPQVEIEAQREAASFEAVREWALAQTWQFTPSQVAAAADVPRPTALRHLRAMQEAGALVDEGPTEDMPMFVVAGTPVDVPAPAPTPAAQDKVTSKVPAIQALLDAAYEADCEVSASNGHIAVTAMDGRRVVIDSAPKGRSRMLSDRAKLRRIGVNV